MLKVTIQNKKLWNKLQNFNPIGRKAIKKGIKDGFELLGQNVSKRAKEAIKDPPKTGRIYTYNGQKHQASAPGEVPANLSGRLMNSVQYKARSQELTYGYTAYYGAYLEYGTRKMKKRPNLGVQARKAERDAIKYMERTIPKAIKDALK